MSDIVKYYLDTPCTAALHLKARDPDTAKTWFSDRNGCFELPKLGSKPSMQSMPKLEVNDNLRNKKKKPIQSIISCYDNNSKTDF